MLFFQIILNSAVTSVQTLLIGAGLYLIYNVSGTYAVHLSLAMTTGAYAYHSLVNELSWHPALGVLGAMVIASLLMLLSYRILRSTIKSGDRSLSLLIAIALLTGGEALLGMLFGSGAKFVYPGVLPVFEFWGLQVNLAGLLTFGFGALATALAVFLLFGTPAGRKMRAVKQHQASSQAIGLSVPKVQQGLFALTGAFIAVNGILLGMNTVAEPTMSTLPLLTALVAFFVGGVHSFKGLVVSSFMIVLSVEVLTGTGIGGINISASWTSAIIFAVALSILLVKPQGLFSINTRQN